MSDTSASEGANGASIRRAWLWWLPPLGWMALIWTFSAQSELFVAVSSRLRDLLAWVAHFSEFAILAALLWLALSKTSAARGQVPLASAFFGATLFAVVDELHQAFVPGRTPDLRDLLVDMAGVLAALALIRWLTARPPDVPAEGENERLA